MTKPVKVFSIVGLTLAWLGWELWANFDTDPNTWPLTWVIVRYVPAWVTLPAVAVLAAWLPWHFWSNYQRKRRRPYPYGSRALSSTPEVAVFAKYRKFWIAAAGVAAVVVKALADGQVDPAEWGEIAIAVATALGVVAVPNQPADPAPPKLASRYR